MTIPIPTELIPKVPLRLWSNAAATGASLLSSASCLWMLGSMSRLQQIERRKLVARQLWHIAVADLWFAVGSIVFFLLAMLEAVNVAFLPKTDTGEFFCRGAGVVLTTGMKASVLMECHMAMNMIATVYQRLAVLQGLSRTLWVAWVIGFLLGVLEMLTSDISYTLVANSGHGLICALRPLRGVVLSCVISTSFLVCLAAYAICSCRVGVIGEALQARIWRRAQLFPLVAVVSYGPAFLTSSDAVPRENPRILFVSQFLLCLNGCLNTAVYVAQGRYAVRLESRYESMSDLMLPGNFRFQVPQSPQAPVSRCPSPELKPIEPELAEL